MAYDVKVQLIPRRILAAVRRDVPVGKVAIAFGPALDLVWAFLKRNPGLRTDGHNVFLYHHTDPSLMPIDFGVEVVRSFAGEGEVSCLNTPTGQAAVVVHRGPYSGLGAAHQALREWCAKNGRKIGRHSLEIYGDPSPDPMKTETTIEYLLE